MCSTQRCIAFRPKLVLHILNKNQAAGDGDLGENSVGIAFGGSGE
jgi:hypothetical protein